MNYVNYAVIPKYDIQIILVFMRGFFAREAGQSSIIRFQLIELWLILVRNYAAYVYFLINHLSEREEMLLRVYI